MRDTRYSYLSLPKDLMRHGLVQSQTVVMHDKPETLTLTEFEYQAQDNDTVLHTLQTLTGFDHDQPVEGEAEPRNSIKQISLRQSMLIDEPLLNRDDNDVEIAYEYDALRRVTRETVSPNDPAYRAWRSYSYELVSSAGQQALQTGVNVKGWPPGPCSMA